MHLRPHLAARLTARSLLLTTMSAATRQVDSVYPGTAVARMHAARERARRLSAEELCGEWEGVRRRLLWAAGLRDLTDVPPGHGYTGHAFNEANHCDATTMLGEVSACKHVYTHGYSFNDALAQDQKITRRWRRT